MYRDSPVIGEKEAIMTELLWVCIGLLLAIVCALLIKIHLLRKSAREICSAFPQKLAEDTNTLIDISSRDSCMRNLASELNAQLQELYQARRRYQQGDLELKEAVTNVSHDLRTPLTAIYGYLALLEREEKSGEVSRCLEQIQNRADAMKSLTEELFRYSIVSSVRELKPERIDLVRALESCLLSFYGAMQEKSIFPCISLPEEPVWRELDADALGRVFSNLISNAIKYSDGDLTVTMQKNGRTTFANTAGALTPVMVGKLFDRFYTVETNRDSTGLGLSIARLLTERMGGKIEADYRDGRLSVSVWF